MTEHVLVTGGAGFVGSHLVDALLAAGHRVRVLDSLETQVHGAGGRAPDYLNPGAELAQGSVTDAAAVARALDGIDVVFHQAALVGVGQSMYDIARYCQVDTGGAGVVLEEIVKRRDRIRKVVVASSMSVYGEGAYRTPRGEMRAPRLRGREPLQRGEWEARDPDTGEPLEPIHTPETKPLQPTSVYAITKRDHEELFLSVGYAYRIPTVALRYFNIYGDRQALSNPYTGVAAIFCARVLNGQPPIIFEDGRQSRDFVHVSDIVQANLLALATDVADYRALNVGTGQPTTIRQVADAILAALGVRDLAPTVLGKFREGDIRHCYADIGLACRLLGYKPTVAFTQGTNRLVEWVRSQRAVDRFEHAHQQLVTRGLA
ncbi:MAG TPA: NAD-dependent epimerase/dehydratase family protein [Gemmatimonadales bacterium]|nr:NAD-dependent epimerase/dehydratase family protein [Gemmatimonadales bacterium]